LPTKTLKSQILQLIELKNKTSETIQNIYHESGDDFRLCIYDDDSIFCENPKGMELMSKVLKKRLIISDVRVRGKYPIKKYFIYKGIEIFCLYKDENAKTIKLQKFIAKIISNTKSFIKFAWGVITFIK
jgi:hypothetical protein